jgi:hypothetical protein
MNEKVEMSLVQGTVTLRINIDGMVDKKHADDENFMKNWFISMAINNISNSDEDYDYDNQVDVLISKETALKYINKEVDDSDWKKIITEHKENKI